MKVDMTENNETKRNESIHTHIFQHFIFDKNKFIENQFFCRLSIDIKSFYTRMSWKFLEILTT